MMKVTNGVTEFLNKLDSDERFKSCVLLIKDDMKKINSDMTTLILNNKIELEANWSSYELFDINVSYEEDMVNLAGLLDMYGFRGKLPSLRSSDKALLVSYQFQVFDAYGSVMDTINIFHIAVKGDNPESKNNDFNEWVLLHDKKDQ